MNYTRFIREKATLRKLWGQYLEGRLYRPILFQSVTDGWRYWLMHQVSNWVESAGLYGLL